MLSISNALKAAYPNAHVGVLAMRDVANPTRHPELQRVKGELETHLRDHFAGQDRKVLDAFGHIPAYNAYYKQFKKSYHVQGQLESIIFKGKAIPSVASLVEAMFMAEVKNTLLTAGHDLDQVQLPLTLNIATGEENYIVMRGQAQQTKANDMFIADQTGIISSIVYGPDQRTQIGPHTCNVIFTVYAPEGIDSDAVAAHLRDIRDYVLIVAPHATVETLAVLNH